MELARHAWRKSFFVYKTSLQNSIRNSSRNSSSSKSGTALNFAPEDEHPVDTLLKGAKTEKISINDKHTELVLDALGATDELSSYIGLAREFACDSTAEHPYVDKLKRVQMILFDLNHAISRGGLKDNSFENKHTKDLEEWIVEYASQLPPPEDYIIPGGGKACASLHVARTICRKAERRVGPLVRDGTLDQEAQIYLNRLSDFLLTVSRMASKCDQRTENIYIPRAQAVSEDK
ncbi:corrinoid adenosyltransferase-like [Venturia canescens]|uniref:corrinoid adenosyltransferase-like n=1 Tax=Venturia canescens TaxID=32260 RepID=UPI001C9CE9CC|nr:corrinoid adenosyltransferase-like [Venturia canescens]